VGGSQNKKVRKGIYGGKMYWEEELKNLEINVERGTTLSQLGVLFHCLRWLYI
jgi:hypothetical protein